MQRFDSPRLIKTTPEELSLPNLAFLDLMQAVLSKGVPFRFMARGWSMSPFIREGDLLTVSPIAISQLKKIGEVYAFIHPGTHRLVVHRAIKHGEDGFLFQGDNSSGFPDGHIPCENVLGKVTKIERHGRRVRLGLGFERYIIVLFSRAGWISPILQRLVKFFKRFSRRNEEV